VSLVCPCFSCIPVLVLLLTRVAAPCVVLAGGHFLCEREGGHSSAPNSGQGINVCECLCVCECVASVLPVCACECVCVCVCVSLSEREREREKELE
jgi:hypothetical protein